MHTQTIENTPTSQVNLNYSVAISLAKAGWLVFPARPDKSPYINGWQTKATSDLAVIHAWWVLWPNAMLATPTGMLSGMAVLDVDIKNGKDGAAALRALGYNLETLSPLRVSTPIGGQHIYFKWHEGLRNSVEQIAQGVDVRGEGGYASYFMINCAHPDHFRHVLSGGNRMKRLKGIVANASRCSHAELDESEVLDDGDPTELGEQLAEIHRALPQITILGGCCGTDMRHMESIVKSVSGR